MLSRRVRFKVFGVIFTALLLAGIMVKAKAQNTPSISVYCSRSDIGVSFTEWLPNESLTALVDGKEIEEYTTSADGSGSYIFPAGATQIALRRENGDTIVVGEADCSKPPLSRITDVNPYNIVLALGGSTKISVTSEITDANEKEFPIIWITESGSFTPDGEITATEEGEHLIMVTHIGSGSSFSFQIPLKVTPAIAKLEPEEQEFLVFTGQSHLLEIIALDENDNPVDVMLDWEVGEAGEVIQPDVFMAGETPGDFKITGTLSGTDLSVEILVHIIPLIERIQIEPDIDTIGLGETQEFRVIGFDADGNEVPLPITPNWSAEIGEIDKKGVYSATAEGQEKVTVTLDLNEIQAQQKGQGFLAGTCKPLIDEELFDVIAEPDESIPILPKGSWIDEFFSDPSWRCCVPGLTIPIFFVLILLGFTKGRLS